MIIYGRINSETCTSELTDTTKEHGFTKMELFNLSPALK